MKRDAEETDEDEEEEEDDEEVFRLKVTELENQHQTINVHRSSCELIYGSCFAIVNKNQLRVASAKANSASGSC